MSRTNPYDRDSLERALVHHGVKYRRPTAPREPWFIDVHAGRDMTDREVYAFLAGYKLARDRAEALAALVREFQEHDLRRYGQLTRGMHHRADNALAPWGYDPVPNPLPDFPTRPRTLR